MGSHCKLSVSRRHLLGGVGAGFLASAVPIRVINADDKKTLVVRQPWDIATLDPAHQANEGDIMGAIYSKLISYAPSADKWGWQLEAAESLEQVDPTHVAFKLRPGIIFSGGFGELTAEDVKYSFERHNIPEVASAYALDWVALDRVDVTDKYSGVIVLKHPYVPLHMTTLCWVAGMILSRKALEQTKHVFASETTPPAMSGPYLLTEWVQKQRFVLERNPDWNGPAPYFDKIVNLPIDDDKAAETAFDAGELDFTSVAMSSVPRLRETPPKDGRLNAPSTLGIDYVGLNTEHPNLSDPRVRRAIQLSVDFDAILQGAYFGVAPRATGLIPPGMTGHRERLLYPGRDVEKAKALLKEAGMGDGLKTSIAVINNADFTTAAQIMQSSLAEAGIELEIKTVDSGTYWSLGFESAGEQWKSLEMYLTRFFLLPDPVWFTNWFAPDQIGIWNWERWNSKEYAELNQQQIRESDAAKRHDILVKMQDLMEESGAYLWITNGIWPTVARNSLSPALTPDGRYMLLSHFAAA